MEAGVVADWLTVWLATWVDGWVVDCWEEWQPGWLRQVGCADVTDNFLTNHMEEIDGKVYSSHT